MHATPLIRGHVCLPLLATRHYGPDAFLRYPRPDSHKVALLDIICSLCPRRLINRHSTDAEAVLPQRPHEDGIHKYVVWVTSELTVARRPSTARAPHNGSLTPGRTFGSEERAGVAGEGGSECGPVLSLVVLRIDRSMSGLTTDGLSRARLPKLLSRRRRVIGTEGEVPSTLCDDLAERLDERRFLGSSRRAGRATVL